VVDKLAAMRGPGESCSDVILRLVEIEAGAYHESADKV
jgi:predicted CopG family antitoxin